MTRGIFTKSIVTGVIAAMATMSIVATAGAENWRFASKMPAGSPEGKVFQYFADEVKKRSGGKFTVKVFPSEQLGKSKAVLEQLQKGTVHIYAEGPAWLNKWAKEMAWVYARFVFNDRDSWVRFMNSDLVNGWVKRAEKASGVRVLGDITGVLRGPFRVVVSKNPVTSIDSFKGLKMRQANSKLGVITYNALGAEVRTLAWTATYQSMKSGIIEAVTSPAALVESMRFYEVAPNITTLQEFYQAIAFMMNGAAFDKLSKANQKILLDSHAAASKYSHEVMQNSVDEAFARMKSKGVAFATLDPKPFVKKVDALLDKWEKDGELPAGFRDAANKANNP
jgi:TRAP-type transport system periplasmic protein